MASRQWRWLTTSVVLTVLAGCTSTGSTAGSTTSSPPGEAPARAPDTVAPAAPEPTGVPGLADTDPFCSAWAAYAGTLQALGIAAAFGELSSEHFAAIELVAASRLVEYAAAIDSSWPTELAAERTTAIEHRIGPYARRAQTAVAALVDAGVTTAELSVLSSAWEAALMARDPNMPVIGVQPLAADLQVKVDAAAVAYDKARTPFAQDPSLTIDGVETPLTDAYLVAHCPHLASSGVGDAL